MYIDENGQDITGYDGAARPTNLTTNVMSALALQIARLALARELERSDMMLGYTRDEIIEASGVLGDILAQRGCGDITADGCEYLTNLMDVVIYG